MGICERFFDFARAVCLVAVIWTLARPAGAADAPSVSEIAHNSRAAVRFTIERTGQQPRVYDLAPGQRTQIGTQDKPRMTLAGGSRVTLESGASYAFSTDARGGAVFGKQARPRPIVTPPAARRDAAPQPNREVAAAKGNAAAAPPASNAGREAAKVAVVTVKIFVDDDEAMREELWRKRLSDRLAAASKITEASAGVRFVATEYGAWDSDDANHDFIKSLAEFEHEAAATPARLAIGFCSQYEATRGQIHLGGTRAPLHPHILLREWSRNLAESERLELLLHELGHYLGAVHSRDKNSVMRPILGDSKSRAREFKIAYDDASAQVIRIVGDELRARPVRSYRDLSDRTKSQLLTRYDAIAKTFPDDPAAKIYTQLLESAGGKR